MPSTQNTAKHDADKMRALDVTKILCCKCKNRNNATTARCCPIITASLLMEITLNKYPNQWHTCSGVVKCRKFVGEK